MANRAAVRDLRETKAALRNAIKENTAAQIQQVTQRRAELKNQVNLASRTIKNLKKKQQRLLKAVQTYHPEVAGFIPAGAGHFPGVHEDGPRAELQGAGLVPGVLAEGPRVHGAGLVPGVHADGLRAELQGAGLVPGVHAGAPRDELQGAGLIPEVHAEEAPQEELQSDRE